MLTIDYPFPPKELNPNKQLHWAAKAKVKKAYREECKLLTIKADINSLSAIKDKFIDLDITFYPPDRRHRDDDNLVATFKSGRDGIADALGINDKMFRIHPVLSDTIGNKVVVTFTPRE